MDHENDLDFFHFSKECFFFYLLRENLRIFFKFISFAFSICSDLYLYMVPRVPLLAPIGFRWTNIHGKYSTKCKRSTAVTHWQNVHMEHISKNIYFFIMLEMKKTKHIMHFRIIRFNPINLLDTEKQSFESRIWLTLNWQLSILFSIYRKNTIKTKMHLWIYHFIYDNCVTGWKSVWGFPTLR